MKRLYTLLALLGLVGLMAGCAPSDSGPAKPEGTNAPVPAPEAPSTNK